MSSNVFGPQKSLPDRFGWDPSDDGVWLNVMRDDGSSRDHSSTANSNAAYDGGAIANPHVIFDYGFDWRRTSREDNRLAGHSKIMVATDDRHVVSHHDIAPELNARTKLAPTANMTVRTRDQIIRELSLARDEKG